MAQCKQCQSSFEVTDIDRAFYEKVSPSFDGKKFPIPEPVLCPDCRLQSRLVWRAERALYKRKCDKTAESIISWIAPDKPQKVYKKDVWWSDSWSALSYGRDFDFNRPFFDQIAELIREVPWLDLLVDNTLNSDYNNFCNNIKNCYLIYASNNNEDCLYSSYIWGCNNVVDCLQAFDCQYCYDSIDINNCYACFYSKNCTNSNELYFCENCQNCKNCFGCVNLVGKQYYFMNQPMSKEDYEKKIAGLKLDSLSRIKEARTFFNQHRLKFPMRYAYVVNSENSTGDSLRNARNVVEGYDTSDAEDSKWLLIALKVKDCYDLSGCEATELCYYSAVTGLTASSSILFSAYTWNSVHRLLYCVLSPLSQDCFGCVGLQRGKYCILNKQYTKEEYNRMVARIVAHMVVTGEWGQFFPVNLSPFDYNETLAQDYFPLAEEEVKKRGWRWRPKESKEYLPSVHQVPDSILEAKDELINQVLACAHCGRNYKIVMQELGFYKKFRIPVPPRCPECRHQARLKLRNPRHLWSRTCAKCNQSIQTPYAPGRPEIVYCESCYLKTVY